MLVGLIVSETFRIFEARAICVGLAGAALSQNIAVDAQDISIGEKAYPPHLHQSYPDRGFWGDTHLHASDSTDARMMSNRLGPDEALRKHQERAYTSPNWYTP